jgi:hypothetical protein
MENEIIDFQKFRSAESKVFSGRDRGKVVRDQINFDELIKSTKKVEIRIPSDVYTVNTSFFLGLFGNIVRKLGELVFREKFIFVCEPSILDDINEGIDRALKENSAI